METINWNSFGEGDYETVDYVTIDGFSLNLDMVKGLSFSEDRIDLTINVKHGFTSFTSHVNKLIGENAILTARISNYHGGYLLASGILHDGGDTIFSMPATAMITFKAKNVRLDTYSNFDEHVYLKEVKKKD
jgi:hypothetical protein